MAPENDKALCEAFPLLYARRSLSSRETPMGRGFTCHDGWYELVRSLSEKLELILRALPENQRFEADQVKEKLGGLRFYTFGLGRVPEPFKSEVSDLIGAAERKSYETCEVCGGSGTRRASMPYIQTLCDACEEARFENRTPEEKHRARQEKIRQLKLLQRSITEYQGRVRNAKTPEAKAEAEAAVRMLEVQHETLSAKRC